MLLIDDNTANTPKPAELNADPAEGEALKILLGNMPDIGEDEDFVCVRDYGRRLPWDS